MDEVTQLTQELNEGEAAFRQLHRLDDAEVSGEVRSALEAFAEGWAHSKREQRRDDKERWKQALAERRYGRFYIGQFGIEHYPEHAALAMAKVIIVRAEFSFVQRAFEYTAASPHFAPVPQGEMSPEYEWVVEDDEVRFRRA